MIRPRSSFVLCALPVPADHLPEYVALLGDRPQERQHGAQVLQADDDQAWRGSPR
jgi:hypothetical protein